MLKAEKAKRVPVLNGSKQEQELQVIENKRKVVPVGNDRNYGRNYPVTVGIIGFEG
jgi:hypothetical protein